MQRRRLVFWSLPKIPGGGGGGLPYETDGDARRLAYGCKFWILVSLRVFRAKPQYFKPPRSRLGVKICLSHAQIGLL